MATKFAGARFEYKTIVKVIFILSLFMQIVDSTVVNVAVPTLADEFGVAGTDVDLAIISYLVALAILLSASGWLGDRFGSKRVFLSALAGFTATSALAGTSQSLEQLVGWRVLQGSSAGIMAPLGSAMLFRAFPQNERAKAATAVIGVAVIAPAVGPIIGGALIEYLSWRWIFYVNVPIGLLGLGLGMALLREHSEDRPGRFDVVGFLLSGLGLALVLFAIDRVKDVGLTELSVTLPFLAGLALLAVLVVHQLRVPEPLLKLRLLNGGIFRATNIVALPVYMGFMSLIFLVPLFLQSIRGFSALDTGFAVFPQALGIMISSQVAGRSLYQRIGPRMLLVIGNVGSLVVGLGFAFVISLNTTLRTIQLLSFGRGLFMGLMFIALQTATYAQTTLADTARATTLFSIQRQLGPAIGISVVATVLANLNDGLATSALAERLDGFRTAMIISALFFLIGSMLTPLVRDEDAAATFV